jgi:hypothetical protein
LASITAAIVLESHDAFSALVLDMPVIAQAHVLHISVLLDVLIAVDHTKQTTQSVQPGQHEYIESSPNSIHVRFVRFELRGGLPGYRLTPHYKADPTQPYLQKT